MCCWVLDSFGSEKQKDTWLSAMASLDLFGSYCLTEPNSGSDSRAMKTYAKKVELELGNIYYRMVMITSLMVRSHLSLEDHIVTYT